MSKEIADPQPPGNKRLWKEQYNRTPKALTRNKCKTHRKSRHLKTVISERKQGKAHTVDPRETHSQKRPKRNVSLQACLVSESLPCLESVYKDWKKWLLFSNAHISTNNRKAGIQGNMTHLKE